MTSRFLTMAAALAFAATLLAASPALPKSVTIVPGDPPIKADIPASWKVSEIRRGVEAKTADGEVFIWFESYRPAQFQKLLAEHNAYFKEQGVNITGEPKQTEQDYPGYGLKISIYPATYEGEPTVLRYISVVPKAADARHLLLSYWASTQGDREYDAEVKTILDSLGNSYDGK